MLAVGGCAGELTERDRQAAAAYNDHRGGSGHGAGTPTTAAALPSEPLTWRQLAHTVGCQATLQGHTSDFRQASCVKDGDAFVFLDFDTARGQRDWLEYAVLYGGIYLSGDRWVLSGDSREYMESLREELGGGIEGTGEHGGS
ncbi:hypothetical protein BLA60_12130 [Actinophytocola xinjiangensis]|uniref:Lipoprotein n=1 Tax=Actinophytocola xinjiangensis TaxID=485602 RepID=A0A7Z1AZW8_9PSEU|nr:hypothetical protein BLA60_12130 [Actinophytocola xinjiangensis]